jgi:CelD/BcsL family acetyltransferase involved in cellulose biosynthesis
MEWDLLPANGFPTVANIWDRLNASNQAVPFLGSEFIAQALAHFGTGRETVVIGMQHGEPVAMGVLTRLSPGAWRTFQPSQLPLGAWVMRPEVRWETLASALIRCLPGSPLLLGITQQDPHLVPRPDDSACMRTLDYIQTAWVDLSGSFDEYWAARGKNLRHNMKRQRAKLEADGIQAVLEELTRAEEVADAIRDYGRLESAGWKAASGTAIHPDNVQGRFYCSLLEAYCRNGAGRIYRYRFDDRVVAVDLCIEGGATQVVLKTTYDESYKSLSPAFLMRQEALRRLFESGRCKRVEFYGKCMEWHTRWTDRVRTLYHINVYRWPLLNRLHAWWGGWREERKAQVPGAA